MTGIYVVIECNHCGRNRWYYHASKKYIVKWARQEGWSVGKSTICPECKSKSKTGGKK